MYQLLNKLNYISDPTIKKFFEFYSKDSNFKKLVMEDHNKIFNKV